MDKFAAMALEEYNSADRTTRRCGTHGRPFWNINSSQFIFAPQLNFPEIPGTVKYIYTATDSEGKTHSFEGFTPKEPLTPIWAEIPVGFVDLKVEAVHGHLGRNFTAGFRTFYKAAPFPGREALPKRACSYAECAKKAFKFVFNDESVNYWLKHGKPDPEYYHNVYPSKTISSLVGAMLSYAEIDPENKEAALKIAITASDYLLSITYGEDSKLCGAPPTYSFKGLNKETVDKTAPAAYGRRHTIMNIYPAFVGNMYLSLEAATGEKKYFDAAVKIAEYYAKNVLPNGSWYLLVDERTGKEESANCCLHLGILNFLNRYYKRTGDERFHTLEKNYYDYVASNSLDAYRWEGQFEDIAISGPHENLTHISTDQMIGYIAKNYSDNPEMMATAEELMRFVEDQFVVWGEHAPWNSHIAGKYWYSPAGLEQYYWYVPIDGSTSIIMRAFLDLYEKTGNELYREKALALADSITRMQNPENGVIPTHWMKRDCMTNLENFWLNCHIGAATQMMYFAKFFGEI